MATKRATFLNENQVFKKGQQKRAIFTFLNNPSGHPVNSTYCTELGHD